jgi:hypothetical protein
MVVLHHLFTNNPSHLFQINLLHVHPLRATLHGPARHAGPWATAPTQARHVGPLARRAIWLNQRKILKSGA